MTTRYIAIVHPGRADRDAVARARTFPGFRIVTDTPALLIVAPHRSDIVTLGIDGGVAIGTMFDRLARGALDHLDEAAVAAAVETAGASLIGQFWGSYVAFVKRDDGGVSVIRDPSGALVCYTFQSDGACVVTSDVRACVAAGLLPVAIDWTYVAGHLLWPERRTRRTGIERLREVMPGERLSPAAAGPLSEAIWTPWQFTAAASRIESRDAAIELVRRATLNSVGAWCKRYPNPLVSLSGGLDSSIVMASLSGKAAGAMTFVTDDPLGDERRYANAVADRYSTQIIDSRLTSEHVDPRRSNARDLPRPISRLFGQALDRNWRDTVTATSADALFHGGGGDNVFCYLASATPYLDSLLVRGPGRESRDVLQSLSRMTSVSTWRVRQTALRKFMIERGRYRWHRDTRLLTSAAIELGETIGDHPWFEAVPPKTLPGKRAHVAALVRIQNYIEAVCPDCPMPVVAPLLSQPVMETCLRVPTWLWYEDGMNRAIARAAFRDRLPSLVIDRRGKGSPDGFDAQVVAANLGPIREMLLDGRLLAEGVVDRGEISAALHIEGPLRGVLYQRLTELVDIEAWLQSWTGADGGAPGAQSLSRSAIQRA